VKGWNKTRGHIFAGSRRGESHFKELCQRRRVQVKDDPRVWGGRESELVSDVPLPVEKERG